MAGKKKGDLQHDNTRNEPLTDDETHALTLQWKAKYERALADKKKAAADFLNVTKKAKAELGDTAIIDIKDMIAAEEDGFDEKFQAELERKARLARWLGLEIGQTADLFTDIGTVKPDSVERATNEGKRAGLAGELLKPPYDGGTEAYHAYVKAWHEGQAANLALIKKTEAKEVPLIVNPDREDSTVDEFDAAASGDDGEDDAPWPDDVTISQRAAEDEEHAAADEADREPAEAL